MTTEKSDELVVVLTENFFRPSRCKQRTAAAVANLTGGKEPQTFSLQLKDFGDGPASWLPVDVLSLRASFEADGTVLESRSRAGIQPRFGNLRWESDDR